MIHFSGKTPNLLYTQRFCGMFDGKKDNCDVIAQKANANISCYSCDQELCNESSFISCNVCLLMGFVVSMLIKLTYK